MLFIAQLYSQRVAPGTMKSYLAAVRYLQISLGLGNPRVSEMPQLEYLLKGAKKEASKEVRRRLPITPEIFGRLRGHWLGPQASKDSTMLWAVLCWLSPVGGGSVPRPILLRSQLSPWLQECTRGQSGVHSGGDAPSIQG